MQKRDIAPAIIFTIITCGIYGIYWFIKLTDETNCATNTPGDTSGAMAFVLTLVTCGIYSIYWAYKIGNKLDEATGQNGSRGILYLVLNLLGFGVISYALIQDTLNKM